MSQKTGVLVKNFLTLDFNSSSKQNYNVLYCKIQKGNNKYKVKFSQVFGH